MVEIGEEASRTLRRGCRPSCLTEHVLQVGIRDSGQGYACRATASPCTTATAGRSPAGNCVTFCPGACPGACVLGLEGIVSKRVTSRYKSGSCVSWVKVTNAAL
jgi:hypothetical protein